ncbi:hypothetical protein NITMOv2_3493 [Nitrospira moscoviensis]|uniref:Uncharacterized protein n=1 Tax=Nitrospira moscoviensis TaxID=42253 RepID=A0A0K2GFZ9_NITMO|nr:hypothetical protein NITMOv2_3493 [Nitrospira moscoviensis]
MFEFVAQLAKVVNLSVVNNDIPTIIRMHRLIRTSIEIDHRQTAMAKTDAPIAPISQSVGASDCHSSTHSPDGIVHYGLPPPTAVHKHTCEPTHDQSSLVKDYARDFGKNEACGPPL